jgi:hypothetical protein
MANAAQSAKSCFVPTPVASPPVQLNLQVCRRLAEWVKSSAIPLDREESSLPGFSAREIGNFYLFLVAISHQTSPLRQLPLEGIVSGRPMKGWDYLFARVEAAARRDSQILFPEFWAHITAEDLDNLFVDERFGKRLSDSTGRALLIRDLGRGMAQDSWRWAQDLYDLAGGRIASGSPSLTSLLSRFSAYRDPVRKKLQFFLALMQNSGIWTYADPDQLGAPIDYHEVRGHLRIGTVEINDADLRNRLLKSYEITLEEDIRIREAVHEVLMFLSDYTELRNPSQIHYLFWNLFRSCCTRESPHCYACPPTCSLPTRYVPLVLHPDGSRHCPFSGFCHSAGEKSKLIEPNVVTDFY